MVEGETAELVFTADGNLKNIVFIEALVAAAPTIKGWRFTALKSPSNSSDIGIKMSEYEFEGEFRKPSLTCFFLQQKYPSKVTMEYTII